MQKLPCEAILQLWRGTVVQRLPCKAMSQSFAWNSWAKAALRRNFTRFCIEPSDKNRFSLSFCMELACKNCLAKLFPDFLHGAVVQKLPHEATCLAFAWNYAKASFQSYFSSFYVELSFKSCFLKLFLELLF